MRKIAISLLLSGTVVLVQMAPAQAQGISSLFRMAQQMMGGGNRGGSGSGFGGFGQNNGMSGWGNNQGYASQQGFGMQQQGYGNGMPPAQGYGSGANAYGNAPDPNAPPQTYGSVPGYGNMQGYGSQQYYGNGQYGQNPPGNYMNNNVYGGTGYGAGSNPDQYGGHHHHHSQQMNQAQPTDQSNPYGAGLSGNPYNPTVQTNPYSHLAQPNPNYPQGNPYGAYQAPSNTVPDPNAPNAVPPVAPSRFANSGNNVSQ